MKKIKLSDIDWRGTKVGVTGDEEGPTVDQSVRFVEIVSSWQNHLPIEFHDGDCIGVDSVAHRVVENIWEDFIKFVGHPPMDDSKQAKNKFDVSWPKKAYLARDVDLARAVNVLIAMPMETREITRSGTWATVRYARARDTIVVIIWPDGLVDVEDFRHVY